VNGIKFPINKEEVWRETLDKYYDKLTGHVVIKGYGTKQSREMSK